MQANHTVQLEEAKEYNQRMSSLLESIPTDDLNGMQDMITDFFCSQAIAYLDILQPQTGLLHLHTWKPSLIKGMISYFGTKARLLRACGRSCFPEAKKCYQQNIERAQRYHPEELPRCLGDYAEFLRISGDRSACEVIQQAFEMADKYLYRNPQYIGGTRLFLQVYSNRIQHTFFEQPLGDIQHLPKWLQESYSMEQAQECKAVTIHYQSISDRKSPSRKHFTIALCIESIPMPFPWNRCKPYLQSGPILAKKRSSNAFPIEDFSNVPNATSPNEVKFT